MSSFRWRRGGRGNKLKPLYVAMYSTLYPDEELCIIGDKIIAEGLLLFREEDASFLSGPYEGGYAVFSLYDTRFQKSPWSQPLDVSIEALTAMAIKEAKEKKLLGYSKEFVARLFAGDPDIVQAYMEKNCLDYPYKLWVAGNDDTSYTRYFRTEEDGLEAISLLAASQPLTGEDIWSLDFFFSN